MKLEKKTIYRVKSKEKFNAMMKDAKEQGFYWNEKGDAESHPDYWDVYCEDTNVRIDALGYMMYGQTSTYEDSRLDHARKEYEITPKIYPINFDCVGIDAPDFETARRMFTDYMSKLDTSLYGIVNPKVYTIRVEDNKTTVITPDGKVATAKCHPDDDFDVVEGFRVALEKIEEQNRKLTQKEKDILNSIIVLGGYCFYIDEDHDLIVEFDDESIYVDIDNDVFKWCEAFEDYNPKELLEKYA